MDLSFSTEDNEFRDEVRTWLKANAPTGRRPKESHAMREFDLAWQRTMHAAGWGGVAWPVDYGGRDLPLTQQLIWYEEYARTGLAPIDSRFVGLAHAGPTLMLRSSEEQKQFHLPKILGGEVIWCQGFSEPEAGSDLASLRTRAVVDGDELVVTGQKIWTSFAAVSDWQELLVRTDPDAPKHKGITWVICDMRSPGIDIRPIRTIEGGADFNEVFYDEVRIPLANVVGDLNDGWSVAMSTLSFERGTAFTVSQVQLASSIEALIDMARSRTSINGRAVIADGAVAERLAKARADCAALRALTYLGISKNAHSTQPGPEGSMLKLQYADLAKRVYLLGLDVIDTNALAFALDEDDSDWVDRHLMAFSTSIGGGTSEIQRNIIGERVLGLPR